MSNSTTPIPTEAPLDDEIPPSPKEPKDRPFTEGYNTLKTHKGQVYSGMAVGGSHIWNYDEGEWKETKEEPDLWKIEYRTNKRRTRKAPRGSGAPVGTEYHWLVVGHQHVKKLDANTYETVLTGSKYKLAHKAAEAGSWSIPTVKAQREREVELLEDAKRRVQGLPPVLAGEKVKIDKQEKGQQKLDALFGKTKGMDGDGANKGKRKREDEDDVGVSTLFGKATMAGVDKGKRREFEEYDVGVPEQEVSER